MNIILTPGLKVHNLICYFLSMALASVQKTLHSFTILRHVKQSPWVFPKEWECLVNPSPHRQSEGENQQQDSQISAPVHAVILRRSLLGTYGV